MLTVGGWHGLREILQIHELNGKRGVGFANQNRMSDRRELLIA
jgi:hypothetical protein